VTDDELECERCDHKEWATLATGDVYRYDVREEEDGQVVETTALCDACKERVMSMGKYLDFAEED
jgi:hypothetical protein